MMYFLLYLCLLLGPCILARHFVFIWHVQTLIFVYMTFVVYGWLWFTFMDMCMDVCLWMCIYGCVWVCVWVRIYGYVYGYRVSILCEAWFNKHRGLPLLGARFHHHWDLLLHEAHFNKFWDLLLREAHLDDSSNFPIFPDKNEKICPSI
jgi:hypothetical protein